MKKPKPVPSFRRVPLALMVASLATCQAPERPAPDPEGPEALVGEWVEMWNSYDLDEVSRLFMDDESLTYFSSEREGVIRGLGELLEHHEGFGFVSGGKDQPNRLWVEDLRSDLFGDVAVLTGIWLFASEQVGATPSVPQRGPVTFVSVWDGEVWRFAHMTFSEYPPPDSL